HRRAVPSLLQDGRDLEVGIDGFADPQQPPARLEPGQDAAHGLGRGSAHGAALPKTWSVNEPARVASSGPSMRSSATGGREARTASTKERSGGGGLRPVTCSAWEATAANPASAASKARPARASLAQARKAGEATSSWPAPADSLPGMNVRWAAALAS